MVTSYDFTHRLRGEDFASSGGIHRPSWLDFHLLQLILASKQTFCFNRNQNEPRQNSKQVRHVLVHVLVQYPQMQSLLINRYISINPFSPNSDQHEFPPNNLHT